MENEAFTVTLKETGCSNFHQDCLTTFSEYSVDYKCRREEKKNRLLHVYLNVSINLTHILSNFGDCVVFL